MNSSDHARRLLDVLRKQGPSSARDLAVALGLSQPTVSRALANADDLVVRMGRARRARYATVRNVRGLGSRWPLFRIDEQGRPQAFGTLTALYGVGTSVSAEPSPDWLRDDFVDGLFPGVPWFLDDLRPQGFLGRQFAHRWSRELGLSADIRDWNDDVVLSILLLHGENDSGNFVLGERALERALQMEPKGISREARGDRYAEWAEAALEGDPVGSSAAGEQPKFTATVEDDDGSLRHVIVKFSEPVDGNASARRWADLLVCEHLASELLSEHGHVGARSELVWSNGRLCLEVTRFDRIGTYGRRGCVTLAAWSDAHDGDRDGWPGAVGRMRKAGWIGDEVLDRVRERWWFGRMIGNTDMHFGNLSFFLDDALPLALTPSYDMLPMMYRPAANGAVIARDYAPAVPTSSDLAAWRQAAFWAQLYWERVERHEQVSDDFRRIANANGKEVARVRQRFDHGSGVVA